MRFYARWVMALALAGFGAGAAYGQGNAINPRPLELQVPAPSKTSPLFTFDELAKMLGTGPRKDIPRSWVALPDLPSGKDELDWFRICLSLQKLQGLDAIELCARRRMTTPDDMVGPVGGAGAAPDPDGPFDRGMPCSKPNGRLGWVGRVDPPWTHEELPQSIWPPPSPPPPAAPQRPLTSEENLWLGRSAFAAGTSVAMSHLQTYESREAAQAYGRASDAARDVFDALRRGDKAAETKAKELYRNYRKEADIAREAALRRQEEIERQRRAAEVIDPWADDEEEEEPPPPPPPSSSESEPRAGEEFLPPCKQDQAMQWCMSRTKADLAYCVKFLSDGIFALTGGQCETVVLPNDQRGMKCRDKDPKPGPLSPDTLVGPFGSTKQWCKIARVAEPIAGGTPACSGGGGGGGPKIKFLDTTHLQKMLDQLCTEAGGLCPEDFR